MNQGYPSPILQDIHSALIAAFSPSHLVITDNSHLHQSHYSAASDGATHLEVQVTSSTFNGLSRIKRHQLVHQCLATWIPNPIHALSLKLNDTIETDNS